MGDLELPLKAEMLWPVGSANHWRKGNSMAPWVSNLPTLAKAVGAVQLCFSSQWITSTLYSPGRFWLPFFEEIFVAYIESASSQRKQKFRQISRHPCTKKDGLLCSFYFCYVFVSFPRLLGTPSPFAKFCQEVSDLNLHRPATEAGKAYSILLGGTEHGKH